MARIGSNLPPPPPSRPPERIGISRRSVARWVGYTLGGIGDARLFTTQLGPQLGDLNIIINELITPLRAEQKYTEPEMAELERAFGFMVTYHGQSSFSDGEKVIIYLLHVTRTLLSWRGSSQLAAAALLHRIPLATLETAGFSPELINLVRAKGRLEKSLLIELDPLPTDLTPQQLAKITEREIRYIAKMSMIRESNTDVWLLAAADAYVTLQTTSAMDPEVRLLAARAYHSMPIALRAFDLEPVAMKVEDIALFRLDQTEYERIEQIISDATKMDRKATLAYLKDLTDLLSLEAVRLGIKFRVEIDVKSVVSAKRKLERGDKLTDPARFRFIIKGTRDQCKALAELIISEINREYVVNWAESNNYIDGIAMGQGIDRGKKTNSYESLHLNLIGAHGEILNVQIRTEEMHENAELGLASHSKAFKVANLVNEAARVISQDIREALVLEGRRYGIFQGRLYRVIPYPAGSFPTLLDLAFAAGALHGLHCPDFITLARLDPQTGETVILRDTPITTPLEQGDRIDFTPLPKPRQLGRRLERARSLPAIVAVKLAQRGAVDITVGETRASEAKAQGEVLFDRTILEVTSLLLRRMQDIQKRYGLEDLPVQVLYSPKRLAKFVGADSVPELKLALALASNRDKLAEEIRQILHTSTSTATYQLGEASADLWLLVQNISGVLGAFVKITKTVNLDLIELRNMALHSNQSLIKARLRATRKSANLEEQLLTLLATLNDLYQGLKPLPSQKQAHFRINLTYSKFDLDKLIALTTALRHLHANVIEADFPAVIERRAEAHLVIAVPELLAHQFNFRAIREFENVKRIGNLEIKPF